MELRLHHQGMATDTVMAAINREDTSFRVSHLMRNYEVLFMIFWKKGEIESSKIIKKHSLGWMLFSVNSCFSIKITLHFTTFFLKLLFWWICLLLLNPTAENMLHNIKKESLVWLSFCKLRINFFTRNLIPYFV